MAILIIAEKPSVAANIANAVCPRVIRKSGYFEGGNYIVTYAIGHLVSLSEPDAYGYKKWNMDDLPIIPKTFKLEPNSKTKKQLHVIRDLLKRPDIEYVVNAADSAREGEVIAMRLLRYLGNPYPVKRLWTSSLTSEAIRAAIQNMKDSHFYDALYRSGEARSQGDWVVGLNGTRLFTKASGGGDLISVGRVQTPTLAMIYDRQKEIENFQAEDYWIVQAMFKQNNVKYKGKLELHFKDPAEAEKRSAHTQGKPGTIKTYQVKDQQQSPPKLYDLTLLQKEANARFGFSAAKTLSIAQALYEEHKATTYPRTNSNYVTPAEIPLMHEAFDSLEGHEMYGTIVKQGNKRYVHERNKLICDPKKVEDHYCILPTNKIPAQLSKDEQKIYDMIVRRFLAHFFSAAQYKQHHIITVVHVPWGIEEFKSSVKEMTAEGWKVAYPKEKKSKQDIDHDQDEQELVKNFTLNPANPVHCLSSETIKKQTQPPKGYTEGTLVAAMESAGRDIEDEELREKMKNCSIGTPATRAGIIERLKQVGYIELQGKKIVVTSKGEQVVEAIRKSGVGLLTSVEMTARWEERLNQIAKGKASDAEFMEKVAEFTQHLVQKVKAMDIKIDKKPIANCPVCQGGEIIEGKKGFGCNRYKEGCDFVIWKFQFGRLLTPDQIKSLITKGRTGRLNFKGKGGKPYKASLVLSHGEVKLDFLSTPKETSSPSSTKKAKRKIIK